MWALCDNSKSQSRTSETSRTSATTEDTSMEMGGNKNGLWEECQSRNVSTSLLDYPQHNPAMTHMGYCGPFLDGCTLHSGCILLESCVYMEYLRR
jgi:hypothetical protein